MIIQLRFGTDRLTVRAVPWFGDPTDQTSEEDKIMKVPDIRDLPGFSPAMGPDERIALVNDYVATHRTNGGIGDPTAYAAVTRALVSATDGATVSASGQPFNGSGYVVAVPEYSHVIELGFVRVVSDAVRTWVATASHHVTGRHLRPRYFGAWVNGDRLYLDVVEVFPDDERDAAVAAGRARNQIAVWDAGRGEEVPTGGTGEVDHAVTSTNPDHFVHPVQIEGTNLWRNAKVDPGF